MDFKNVQDAKRSGMRDMPSETDIDYEREVPEESGNYWRKEDSEELKKLGRQTEV